MKSNKRGLKRGEIETRKLIQAIIVLVVIVVVVLFIASQAEGGAISNLLKFIPDFIKQNYTVNPNVQCPFSYTEVGYIDKSNYIILNGKKTNLYVNGNDVKISIPIIYKLRDKIIGTISNGIIDTDISPDVDQMDFDYSSLFPDEKDRRLLFQAKIFEGTLCLPNDLANRFANADSCVLTCEISDGVCSASAVTGKVAFKQIDCTIGQLCYVDGAEGKMTSLNLIIGDESSYSRFIDSKGSSKNNIEKITLLNSLEAIIPERIELWVWMHATIPYCYSFDTNSDKKLNSNYENLIDNSGAGVVRDKIPISSYDFSYSGDGFIQFAAWNNKEKQKVIKRWKFDSKGIDSQYKDGEIIKDGEFGYKSRNAKIGKIFYVIGLDRTWETGKFSKSNIQTSDYKIKVEKFMITGNPVICIYARDRIHGAEGKAESWHNLYCNKGFTCSSNWYTPYCINPRAVSDSLTETFNKQCCWEF